MHVLKRKTTKKIMIINAAATTTSGEINSQSKQDIVCRIAKVKSATSAHYLDQVISFFSVCYVPFESNASIKPEKFISHALKTK